MGQWLRTTLDRLAAGKGRRGSRVSWTAAYVATHTADFGPPGSGACPVCGHKECFGRNASDPAMWYCFSAGHGLVLGVDGRPVGRLGRKGYVGDIVDLHAFQAGRSRGSLLRAESKASRAVLTRRRQQPAAAGVPLADEVFEERLAVRMLDGGLPEPLARVLASQDAEQIQRWASGD